MYRTEFTRSPVISERGMVLDMALYRSAGQQLGNLTVLSQTSRRGVKKRDMHVSERSRSLSFTMAQPSHRTSLQPFLTPAFLTQLNPILLSSIEAGLGALDLSVSQTVRNPMRPNAAMEINMTRLRIYDVQWDKGSGVMFGDGVIKVNASLSSKVDVSYFTNSK